jgi:hypothetical protein
MTGVGLLVQAAQYRIDTQRPLVIRAAGSRSFDVMMKHAPDMPEKNFHFVFYWKLILIDTHQESCVN